MAGETYNGGSGFDTLYKQSYQTLDLSDDTRRYFRDRVVPAWCAPETKARIRTVLERKR